MNANSGDVKSKDTQIFTVGSQYRFDSFTLYGTYQYVTHARLLPDFDITLTDAAINSGMIKKGFNSHAFSVSGAFPAFGGTFKTVINYMNGKAKDGEVKPEALLTNIRFLSAAPCMVLVLCQWA